MVAAQEIEIPSEEPLLIEFSNEGGFYQEPVSVELYCKGAIIYYTLDGSFPSKDGIRYEEPFVIEETSMVRAIAIKKGIEPVTAGHTYFINEPTTQLPIVSIGISSFLLFDPEEGLFVNGPEADKSSWHLPGANFWSRNELIVQTEIYEADQTCVFRSHTGFRLFGGMSRLFPQKSIALVARKSYGKKRFKHRIFGEDGLKKFKFLVLRNSGSDFGKSHMRDVLMTDLAEEMNLEQQDYRPAHVYINGNYWGIYHIREKINRYFIAGHHDVDKDSIDLIEHKLTRKRGRTYHYRKLLAYLEAHDLSQPQAYAYVNGQMEVENFMDLQIAQIYFDNRDAGGNIKFWRPQKEGGRWRWILYDTDWGFGLHQEDAYRFNTLAFHTDPHGPNWPNPPWSTFILRKLLENETFRRSFVNRFCDHLNQSFHPAKVLYKIDQLYQILNPEIDRHFQRWNLSRIYWEKHLARMKTFGTERPDYCRIHLKEMFDTGAETKLALTASEGGHILLNENLKIGRRVFEGVYFENIPITIKAVPGYGYRFSHWEGMKFNDPNRELTLSLDPSKPLSLKAVFEPYEHPLMNKLVINEIYAYGKKAGDWVELYNDSNDPVDLTDWVLTDQKHAYRIPKALLRSKDYIVICEDTTDFKKTFPHQYNYIGNIPFGLNKRQEAISLFSPDGAVVDSFSYQLEPSDTAFSMALIMPRLDNADIDNWEMIAGQGTPNSPNPTYFESSIKAEQTHWVRIGVGIGLILVTGFFINIYERTRKKTN